MRKKTEALVISFGTTTEAMKMERHCEKEGLPGRLIPIPREITAGCGMAWKAKPTEKELLQQAETRAAQQAEKIHAEAEKSARQLQTEAQARLALAADEIVGRIVK